ncbi:myosin heavy chain, clone 203-like [Hyperolius riggenbachi]|uniref:myosin heavy chain, clone 203-like n=1 Tax=Hyperolius riggenbachi TaxID=752182 RepID=UPI0035A29E32
MKQKNLHPVFLDSEFRQTNENHYFPNLPAVSNSNRIAALEKERNDIKMKMTSPSLFHTDSNFCLHNFSKERQIEKVKNLQIQEQLMLHADLMEAKCNEAQREKDALELQMTSLHSGLHQAKMTSKALEKECVKLQSQIAASRNINEGLCLEASSLKKHSQTLENTIEGTKSENKSLQSQVENLQQEKQSLISQKELLFEIVKKKEEKRRGIKEQKKRTPRQVQGHKYENSNCISSVDGNLPSELPRVSSLRSSIRPAKLWRKKELKYDSKGDSNQGNRHHQDDDSKRSEMNTKVICARYQNLADLLRKLECLLKNKVKLDHEKEHIFTFLLGTLEELKDSTTTTDKSQEEVEQRLKERSNLKEHFHTRVNQITAVIIELTHLKQAYNASLRHSEDPDDRDAMMWISRVQAIKDSLKLLKLQDQTIDT